MRKNALISKLWAKYFDPNLDLRLQVFHLLLFAGTATGVIIAIVSAAQRVPLIAVVFNLLPSAMAILMLNIVGKKLSLRACCWISVIFVFMVAFPIQFFATGGYRGGTPSFFIFAFIFTAILFEKLERAIVLAALFIIYVGCCLIAFFYPGAVTYFDTEADYVSDIIIGVIVAGVLLMFVIMLHNRMYRVRETQIRELNRELEAANDAKSRFLANMSHEIRTPLGVVLGRNEIILRDAKDPHILECGRRIETAGKTLHAMISNVLDMSAIEKGKREVKTELYDTFELIDSVCVMGEESTAKRGLSFTVSVDEGLPRKLVGDLGRVRQIVSNLLSNAAKYTETGGVALFFFAMPTECAADGERIILRVTVADTGVGIKSEELPLLFNAFERAEKPSGKYTEGTGLGLAIAKEYAELIGGRIKAESELGKGSVFTLEVEQAVSDRNPVGRIAPGHRPEQSEAGRDSDGFIAPGCSVLLVDDSRENLQTMKLLLDRTLLRVDAVSSGEACIEAVRDTRYDVILMDYMMPGMDGLATLRHLHQRPGFNTPVLAVTANVVTGVREKLLEEGFSAYLSKPVLWPDLQKALMALLPGDSVTVHKANSVTWLADEDKDRLAEELSGFGVSLDDGLRFLGGDIALYGRLASFLLESFVAAKNEACEKVKNKDWKGLYHCVHSLKSRARGIGANRLSETAAKLEELCGKADGEYITALLPVLYVEWERARDGLGAFVSELEKLLPEAERKPPPSCEELIVLLKYNRQPDAMEALALMIEAETEPKKAAQLREIRKKVYEIEFREAERLLSLFMEDVKHGE